MTRLRTTTLVKLVLTAVLCLLVGCRNASEQPTSTKKDAQEHSVKSVGTEKSSEQAAPKSSEQASNGPPSEEVTAKDVFLLNVAHGYPTGPGAEQVDWDISGVPLPVISMGKLVRSKPQEVVISDHPDALPEVYSRVTLTWDSGGAETSNIYVLICKIHKANEHPNWTILAKSSARENYSGYVLVTPYMHLWYRYIAIVVMATTDVHSVGESFAEIPSGQSYSDTVLLKTISYPPKNTQRQNLDPSQEAKALLDRISRAGISKYSVIRLKPGALEAQLGEKAGEDKKILVWNSAGRQLYPSILAAQADGFVVWEFYPNSKAAQLLDEMLKSDGGHSDELLLIFWDDQPKPH